MPPQALWPFWKKVQKMYNKKRLLHPKEDPDYPDGFFGNSWAGRGREYRMYFEPVDIANWCGFSLARHPFAASR